MKKDIFTFESEKLNKEVEAIVYGHFGVALMLFPTFTDSVYENEERGLVESLAEYIKSGKCRVFSIPGINKESWFATELEPEAASKNHLAYNEFILEEVVPLIFNQCGGPVPILTCGASLGAFHAANTYFRRPDIFYGTVALSGTFNIEHLTKGYFDDNCYFNSPIHYLPNLNDSYWLSFLQSRHHVYLLSGSGENEFPQNSVHLGEVLSSKNIPHSIDIWGYEFGHNFGSWNKMLPRILGKKL